MNDEIKQLKRRIEELEKKIDSSNSVVSKTETYKITLKPEEDIQIGAMFLQSLEAEDVGVLYGFSVVGKENPNAYGFGNNTFPSTQLTIQHGTTANDTFYYGYRPPLYVGEKISIVSGKTTMGQVAFNWTTNELVGAYINVYNDSVLQYTRKISSNDSNSLTVDTAWSSTLPNATYIIFMPVYFGAADYPWRRLYTGEGTGEGIRFGYGVTAGGQNGLLYMDSGGDLYWRNKGGGTTKLNHG